MERRFNTVSTKETRRPAVLQKQVIENWKPVKPEPVKNEPVPDLTELMNDWFFGNSNKEFKSNPNNMAAEEALFRDEDEGGLSPRNINSRLTQEWLEEAKRVVALSPSRGCDSPTRLTGSPRFASAAIRDFDRRDPLSRSARRHRAVEGFGGEILSKSARHTRNRSVTVEPQPNVSVDVSPASAVQQWFSNILRPHTPSDQPKQQDPQEPSEEEQPEQTMLARPPRLPVRKSRFRDVSTDPQAIPPRRTFKPPASAPNMQILSPPKNLIESAHRRSISISTCSLTEDKLMSPPRNLVEIPQRRSISASSCALDRISSRPDSKEVSQESADGARDLNAFLKEQREKIRRISNRETNAKAKIVLSGSSNSTSSMVAAICYAWLLESRIKENKEQGGGKNTLVVLPVMNMRRARMWKQRQVAWLFHHVGIDVNSLLFSDEVDLENLMMMGKLSITVIGQDILKTNNEVGSQCTILTDNYCEDAYDLLQIPVVKKLLLAGILLDTQNLNLSTKLSINRDSEAVQLLLVGSAPDYRNNLFDQLMRDQRDDAFLESLRLNYGKPPSESGNDSGALVETRVSGRKSSSGKNVNDAKPVQKTATKQPAPAPSPSPAPTPSPVVEQAARPKNKNFIAKLFGWK